MTTVAHSFSLNSILFPRYKNNEKPPKSPTLSHAPTADKKKLAPSRNMPRHWSWHHTSKHRAQSHSPRTTHHAQDKSMATREWKSKYDGFIKSKYKQANNTAVVEERFQAIANELRDTLPSEGDPKDGHLFATHMTQFYHDMQHAKDSFLRASDAFYAIPKDEMEVEK